MKGRNFSSISTWGDRHASEQIVIKFHSETRHKKRLERLVDELMASKTHDCNGNTVPLSSLVTQRDQSNLIRLLGAKGSYSSMLKLLRHFHYHLHRGAKVNNNDDKSSSASQNIINSGVYQYTAAMTALAQSSNPRWKTQAVDLLDEMDDLHIPPNTYTFTAIFLAVDGGKAAVEILQRAKRYPDTVDIGTHIQFGHTCM